MSMSRKPYFKSRPRKMGAAVNQSLSEPRLPGLCRWSCHLLCSFFVTISSIFSHAQVVQVPAATLLSVQLPRHVPMKAGESLEGRLLYPVYIDNKVAISAAASFVAVLRSSIRTNAGGSTPVSGAISPLFVVPWFASIGWCSLAEPCSRS